MCSGWGWGLIWYLQVEVRKEVCLFRQRQIRLTAVPGSQAIFSSSCRYSPCSHYTPLSCSPASFRAMFIYYLQAVLFSSSVPYLFDFSNDCIVQVLLSCVSYSLYSYWCFHYEISNKLFGSCLNKRFLTVLNCGPSAGRSRVWWFYCAQGFNVRAAECACFPPSKTKMCCKRNLGPMLRHRCFIGTGVGAV